MQGETEALTGHTPLSPDSGGGPPPRLLKLILGAGWGQMKVPRKNPLTPEQSKQEAKADYGLQLPGS